MPQQPRPLNALERFQLVPMRERIFVVYALSCTLAPALINTLGAVADPKDSPTLYFLYDHPKLLITLCVLCLLGGLFTFERPRSTSPRQYLSQLTTRWTTTLNNYDAAVRRLEHDNDEVR